MQQEFDPGKLAKVANGFTRQQQAEIRRAADRQRAATQAAKAKGTTVIVPRMQSHL